MSLRSFPIMVRKIHPGIEKFADFCVLGPRQSQRDG